MKRKVEKMVASVLKALEYGYGNQTVLYSCNSKKKANFKRFSFVNRENLAVGY